MRSYRKQFGWAVGISMACHLIVGGVLFITLPGGRSPKLSADPPIDTTIAATEDYQPIRMMFDEPAPQIQPPSPPIKSVVVPKVEPVAIVPKDPGLLPSVPTPPSTSMNPAPISSGQGNAGGSAPVQPLHGPRAPGSSIVYVLDRSGSMGQGKKLAHAVAILKASLKQLGPEVRFQIVAYDSEPAIFRLAGNLELVAGSKQNILEAENMLDDLVAEGSSRHAEGLRVGLGLRPDLLILLTDAGDLSSADARRLKLWNQKPTKIHAVLIGSADGENVDSLRDLAGKDNVHLVSLPEARFIMP